jgi:hypothetical protein
MVRVCALNGVCFSVIPCGVQPEEARTATEDMMSNADTTTSIFLLIVISRFISDLLPEPILKGLKERV